MHSKDTRSTTSGNSELQKRTEPPSQNINGGEDSILQKLKKSELLPWIAFLVIAASTESITYPDSAERFLLYLVGNGFLFYAIYRSFPRLKRLWKALKGKAELETITQPDGFFFGTEGKQDIGKPSSKDGHILIMGGAGSGKTSAIAIPTLRDYWQDRFLAVDIKGELAEKSKRKALIFNPLSSSAYGYDPFYLARQANDPTPYIRDIALALVPLPPETKQPFFIQSAQNILTGHLLAW